MEPNNIERYKTYISDISNVWKYRFTWNDVDGLNPQNAVSIVKFVKETNVFDTYAIPNNSNDFYKYICKISNYYADWTCTKVSYTDEEKHCIKDFFKGAIGEYFFMTLFEKTVCLEILDEHTKRLKRYDFDNIAPRLIDELDYGVDLTGMVSHDNVYYNCAIQVKFWNPESYYNITTAIAQSAHSDAIDNNFIKQEDNKNIIICWLGTPKNISLYLKRNAKLYRHLLFVDNTVLDRVVNNKIPQFWTYLWEKLKNIKNM